ncbi:hypothetical protein [Bacillus niameyensis]|uniref:hypothetical protein n=1 Tax=Bacillus niameyensis TaxID=1522308 RepID=UPI000785F503|nr:hypothetical protein [Bacillus niameyensis]
MFIQELANIYSKIPYLNEIIPFYEISPQIELFLNQEIRLGANNLNPYRFSYKFAHDPKDVINLFIAFSASDGPLKRMYRYECSECEETNILSDEEIKNFKCYNCYFDGDMEKKEFLDNVKVIFEIKQPYLKEVKNRLKDQASSDIKSSQSGEAKLGSPTLKEIFEMNRLAKQPLDNELERLEEYIFRSLSRGLSSI